MPQPPRDPGGSPGRGGGQGPEHVGHCDNECRGRADGERAGETEDPDPDRNVRFGADNSPGRQPNPEQEGPPDDCKTDSVDPLARPALRPKPGWDLISPVVEGDHVT